MAGHGVAEGAGATARAAVTGLAAHRGTLGAVGDVLALGEHGRGEGHDAFDGRLRSLGDSLRGLTRTDAGLDVTGTKRTVHLNLQLAEAGVVAE